MKAYSGYLANNEKLQASSSGGIITALAEITLAHSGVVFGVKYSDDFKHVEYMKVECNEELELIKGTKYCSSNKIINGTSVYKLMGEILLKGDEVLFVGLGCDVGAAYAYCKKNKIPTSKLGLVDIICHGPLPDGILESYILNIEKEHDSKVISFQMRKKIENWTPYYVEAIFENGDIFREPFDNSVLSKVFKNVACPKCTQCQYKGANHKGDICVGDFWGINSRMEGWNPKGVSAIIVQTSQGEKLLERLDERFIIKMEDYNYIVKNNSMYYLSRTSTVDYNQFMQNFKENGLEYAVAQLPEPKLTLKEKVKKLIPYSIMKIIRKNRN